MIVDDTPPPISLRRTLQGLAPGQSVLATDYELSSVQSIVSRFKKGHQEREFTVRMTGDGPRVWRLV